MSARVLVIGLDGATLDLIQPWVDQGHLPNLARLMTQGKYGKLRSVYPVLSPSAWASFSTGVNPGKHGLIDFVVRDEHSYQLNLINRTHVKMPSLWRLLSEYGKRVGVINVPLTYPPEPVNGVLVTGLGTPADKTFTYPAELSQTLRAEGYRVDKEIFYHPAHEDQYLTAVYDTVRSQLNHVQKLLVEDDWDFFMYVFRDTDELAHFFWQHMDKTHPQYNQASFEKHGTALLDYYSFVDHQVGTLIDQAGEAATVFIVSDHGFGPLYKDVFLNEWLAQTGFLTKKRTATRQRLFSQLGITRSGIADRLRRLGLYNIEKLIKQALGDRVQALPKDARPEFASGIDWSRTKAYSFGYHGQIFLNVKGREPNGIILEEDYEMVREEIITALQALTDPEDGLPVVDQVFTREEVFSGDCLPMMPDLVVVMRDFAYITRNGYELGDTQGSIFCPPFTHESGSHRLDGILFAQGPTISSVGQNLIETANLVDVMPTILYLLDCPIPTYVDGEHLSILSDEWLNQHEVTYTDDVLPSSISDEKMSWDAEDERMIKEQLKKLGYLD
ncbi:MAG: alkaline phosphatase family protein [Chloroflexota bacterium]